MNDNTMNTIYIKDNTALKDSRYDIQAQVGKKSFTLATCWDSELAQVIRDCIEAYFTKKNAIKPIDIAHDFCYTIRQLNNH